MKRFYYGICILVAALISLCFTVTAFADEINYVIDFTREEAYEAVMNTSPVAAENLYGGKASYYEALTDADKEQLFDAMWNLTESGLLYEGSSTVHLDDFADEYFSAVIDGFRETESDEEGLNNLRGLIGEINTYCDSNSDEQNVEILEKTEPAESQASTLATTTLAATTAEETLAATTAPATAPQQGKHTVLIVILCIVTVCAVGAGGYAGYLLWQNKKKK